MAKLLLIDLNNLSKRAYHGGADPLAMIRGIIRRHRPSHMVSVRDPHGPTWHSAEDPSYKAHRKPNGPSSTELVDALAPRLAEAGYVLACADGFAADDLIASLATRAWTKGTEVLIWSGDKDLLQCVRPGVTVLRPENGGGERLLRTKEVREMLGVWPHQVPDWLALCGDEADGIPRIGIARTCADGKSRLYGFTEARAAEIVSGYGGLDGLYGEPDTEAPTPLKPVEREWLAAGRECALLNLRLATLREDVPFAVDAAATRLR